MLKWKQQILTHHHPVKQQNSSVFKSWIGVMAQMVRQKTLEWKVQGSIPVRGKKKLKIFSLTFDGLVRNLWDLLQSIRHIAANTLGKTLILWKLQRHCWFESSRLCANSFPKENEKTKLAVRGTFKKLYDLLWNN